MKTWVRRMLSMFASETSTALRCLFEIVDLSNQSSKTLCGSSGWEAGTNIPGLRRRGKENQNKASCLITTNQSSSSLAVFGEMTNMPWSINYNSLFKAFFLTQRCFFVCKICWNPYCIVIIKEHIARFNYLSITGRTHGWKLLSEQADNRDKQ